MKFGEIEIIDQPEGLRMPQEAASAWHGAFGTGEILGASYKAITYVGGQPVKGVNHVFIAQQTLVLAKPERHIVLVTINEFDGNYNITGIERIV